MDVSANNLEYEDQVRAIASSIAIQCFANIGTTFKPDQFVVTADLVACYIANGMTPGEYEELMGEKFNVYDRNKAAEDSNE